MSTAKILPPGIPLVDSQGGITGLSIAELAERVGTALGIPKNATVMKKVIIPSVDTDFNTLTDDMTVYSFVSDVPKGVTLTNSPKRNPSGGFALRCIKEGTYLRQEATFYLDESIYVRVQHYSANSYVWSDWVKIQGTKSGGVISCTHVDQYRVIVTEKGGSHEHFDSIVLRHGVQLASIGEATEHSIIRKGNKFGRSRSDVSDSRLGNQRYKTSEYAVVRKLDSVACAFKLNQTADLVYVERNSENLRPLDVFGKSMECVVSGDTRNTFDILDERREVVAA